MQVVAKRLAEFQPNDMQWTISLAYATRRADSLQAAKEILSNAESKFPKDAIIKYNLACYCWQLGESENAKNYLKTAFEIDSTWRLKALDDEELENDVLHVIERAVERQGCALRNLVGSDIS